MRGFDKARARELRKKGFTYREIQEIVPVAKSTLSNWVSDIVLSTEQRKRIEVISRRGRKRGNYVRRELRKERMEKISIESKRLITEISDRELWLIGLSLYWAEGNKPKPHNLSQRVQFSNSDPKMILLFMIWLSKFEKIQPDDLIFELYIHEVQLDRQSEIVSYWASKLCVKPEKFDRIYIKTNKPKRKYRSVNYGTLRITVPKSTNLNRKILSLADTICLRCGIV